MGERNEYEICVLHCERYGFLYVHPPIPYCGNIHAEKMISLDSRNLQFGTIN